MLYDVWCSGVLARDTTQLGISMVVSGLEKQYHKQHGVYTSVCCGFEMCFAPRHLPGTEGAGGKIHIESRCCAVLIYNLIIDWLVRVDVYAVNIPRRDKRLGRNQVIAVVVPVPNDDDGSSRVPRQGRALKIAFVPGDTHAP